MNWRDIVKGDVVHFQGATPESYLVLEDPRRDTDHVHFRLLCLDDGCVYDDARRVNDAVPHLFVVVVREEPA